MDNIIFALDIGTRTVLGTVCKFEGKKIKVLAEAIVEHEDRAMVDGQIHDINLVAKAIDKVKSELEEKLDFVLTRVAIAAAGRFLRTVETRASIDVEEDEINQDIIRGLVLTAVKNAEEEINVKTEGKLFCVGHAVKNYYLNDEIIKNLLYQKGEKAGVEVIATFLPNSVVDSLYSATRKANLTVTCLTLEPIAAIEAVIPEKLRLLNLALVDIGAGTSDIAISSNQTISAFGMVANAGDEITETIAKHFLLDFDSAEEMKRALNESQTIKYTDVLGLSNEVSKEEIINIIAPSVKKLSEEIASAIVKLNGEKSPSAVFLVGGGAHTPTLKEEIAKKLEIPENRIAIKDRTSLENCEGLNTELGSTGVTVIGIAIDSVNKSGADFIDVTLNGAVVSLFNYNENTVMDLVLQAGFNPSVIMAKNGKNIRFTLNGVPRVGFGDIATPSKIWVNGKEVTVDEGVRENDKVEIEFAKDGKAASPRIYEYIQDLNSIGFYFNDRSYFLEPIAKKNGEICDINSNISESDDIEIINPSKFGEFKKYYLEESFEFLDFYCGDQLIGNSYEIQEGDVIFSDNYKEHSEGKKENKTSFIDNRIDSEGKVEGANLEPKANAYEENKPLNLKKVALTSEEENILNGSDFKEVSKKEMEGLDETTTQELNREERIAGSDLDENPDKKIYHEEILEEKVEKEKIDSIGITVTVNGQEVNLRGKERYIFVDVFDKVDFDLSTPKGLLDLKLNGSKASFYDRLNHGDEIIIGWQ